MLKIIEWFTSTKYKLLNEIQTSKMSLFFYKHEAKRLQNIVHIDFGLFGHNTFRLLGSRTKTTSNVTHGFWNLGFHPSNCIYTLQSINQKNGGPKLYIIMRWAEIWCACNYIKLKGSLCIIGEKLQSIQDIYLPSRM